MVNMKAKRIEIKDLRNGQVIINGLVVSGRDLKIAKEFVLDTGYWIRIEDDILAAE